MKIKDTWNQVPYNKLSRCNWEKQEQHGSYGERQLPIACAGVVTAYTMRFDLKPEAIIHDLRVFRKLYILCVVERTLCRAFDACTVFSCFLHPSWGGAYTQEVYHENLRFYRPQAQGPGLPGVRRAVYRSERKTPVSDYQDD